MAPAAALAVFLLCCSSVLAAGSQDVCDLYAEPGTSVTLNLLKYTWKTSDNLRWLKDETVIYNSKNEKLSEGKNYAVDLKGSLKLTKVTKESTGRYSPEVYKDGVRAGDLQSMRLCVIDRVKKPTVTMKCVDSKKKVSFTCNFGQDETFVWFMDDKKLEDKEKTLTREASKVAYNSFSCNASNPISSEISLPVQQKCFEPSFPEELWGISIWVFVGGGAGVVLVLMLIVIICCIQTRRKRQMRIKDEREFRLDYANQHHHHHHQQQQLQHQNQNHPDQHHHPPHHPHQQQPAGNTGPRQPRSKQQRPQQRPRAPEPPNGHPQPSPRRAAQATRPAAESNEEQPPPLPQPRKKKAPRE